MANPYPAGTPEFHEYEVWEKGRLVHGIERDFLRAFHSFAGVYALQACIQGATGAPTRVTSMWIDRFPIAYPSLPSTPDARELADLAIVVRAKSPAGSFRQRMLMLQGKVDSPSWTTSGMSPKEIDLLEKVPPFELLTSSKPYGRPLGRFNLQLDFGVPPPGDIPFWAYLLFAPPAAQSTIKLPSHAYTAWPSTVVTQESFFSCVIDQTRACLGTIPPPLGVSPPYPPRGADVDKATPCKEWRRLYLTLALHVHHKLAAKLPGGSWKNIVPFGISPLPDYPQQNTHSHGTHGFVTTGFRSSTNAKVSGGYALELARMFQVDRTDNGFLQDLLEGLRIQGRLQAERSSADGDGDSPSERAPGSIEDGPGFAMIFVDSIAEPHERGRALG